MKTNLKMVTRDIRSEHLEEIANHYKRIKREIEAKEEELKPFKEILTYAAMHSPDMKLVAGPFKVAIIEVKQERFDLKAARCVVAEDVLKPFIKASFVTQLRVS